MEMVCVSASIIASWVISLAVRLGCSLDHNTIVTEMLKTGDCAYQLGWCELTPACSICVYRKLTLVKVILTLLTCIRILLVVGCFKLYGMCFSLNFTG